MNAVNSRPYPDPSRIPEVAKTLMSTLAVNAERKAFFNTFSRLLQKEFHFDRLCINLYDQEGEMLTYFTAAEGTMVSTLSPVRPAEVSSTVAGHVIATRKPVVITDFAEYFPESSVHPIAEAGLSTTMAFPLILDNEIIATLHCSFADKPDNLYEITSFLLELSPFVATCLGSILRLEQLRYNETHLAVQPLQPFVPDESLICHSRVMREVVRKIDMVAKLNIPVLLLGETGTGKSLIAQYIHRRSPRKDARFVKVNCPSLSPTLFESELFGHAKGAFTGAANKRVGRFELAHNGTLFLDEIAELSPEMQSKLLQVLEDSNFERVGESVPLAVDVRMVAATNIRPGEALASGKLRPDLFYRLALCTVELPPLRERKEDIAPLFIALSGQMALSMGLSPIKFSSDQMAPLLRHSWPGNIRELRNVICKFLIYNSLYKHISPDTIEAVLQESHQPVPLGQEPAPSLPPPVARTESDYCTLAEIERRHIAHILECTGGIIAGRKGAAAVLGIPRTTLQHRMKKLGITWPSAG